MTRFCDLYALPEDERIDLIGHRAKYSIVGVVLENEAAKIARYIAKVEAGFAAVRHLDTAAGPVRSTVIVRFCPRATS